jgi:hypothetical protein
MPRVGHPAWVTAGLAIVLAEKTLTGARQRTESAPLGDAGLGDATAQRLVVSVCVVSAFPCRVQNQFAPPWCMRYKPSARTSSNWGKRTSERRSTQVGMACMG